MPDEPRYPSFAAFWPSYVRDHSLALTRRLHFAGLVLAFIAVLAAITLNWRLMALAPAAGYGFAWYAHFFIEQNRPATFSYPVWSLMGDFRMFWLMLRGRMDAEAARHAPDAGRAS